MYFICILVMNSVIAQENSQVITVRGEGNSKTQAIDQAKRMAVEQALGTVLSSETLIENYQLVNDHIISRANGFIKTYREIETQVSEGIYSVIIQAEVTRIFDEILKDQAAVDLLIAWMDKPRFMIIVEENNCGENTEACETALTRRLKEWNFDLVSKKRINPELLEGRISTESITQISTSAYREGAELILIGKALAQEKDGIEYFEGTGMKSVQADFTAQIIEAHTGRIYASYATHDAAVHISEITAGNEALTNASIEMADSLIAALLKWAGNAQISARSFRIVILDAGFTDFSIIRKKLSDIPLVESVQQRSFSAGEGVLSIDYCGKIEDLAVQLDGYSIDTGDLFVEELTAGTIKIMFTPR